MAEKETREVFMILIRTEKLTQSQSLRLDQLLDKFSKDPEWRPFIDRIALTKRIEGVL